ncbi:MAG TPA: DUF3298 domain-containing protein [Oscillospiraceae bacterium]|nr:DUF3298 domain-containing protein [Oscillospiraceae bacterium]
MRNLFAALVAALLLGLSACGGETTVSPSPSPTETESPSPSPTETAEASPSPSPSEAVSLDFDDITYKVYEETFKDEDGNPILHVYYEVPQFSSAKRGSAQQKINSFYEDQLAYAVSYAQGELHDYADSYAEDSHLAAAEYYEDEIHITCRYRDDGVICFTREYYNYFGGAHANELRVGDTFSLDTGARLTASHIFTVSEEVYRPMLLGYMESQVREMGEWLYDTNMDTIDASFDPDNFYLREDGLVFFFQPSDVAPYAAGIVEFSVTFDKLASYLIAPLSGSPAPAAPQVVTEQSSYVHKNASGQALSTMRAELPRIRNAEAGGAYDRINGYYDDLRRGLELRCDQLTSGGGVTEALPSLTAVLEKQEVTGGVLSVMHSEETAAGAAVYRNLKSACFDLTSGAQLYLDNVFTVGRETYMARLLPYVVDAAMERVDEEFRDAQREAVTTRLETWENQDQVDNFYLTDTELILVFDGYAVFGASVDPLTVTIPLSDLADIYLPW